MVFGKNLDKVKKEFMEAHKRSLAFPTRDNQSKASKLYFQLNDEMRAQLEKIGIVYTRR